MAKPSFWSFSLVADFKSLHETSHSRARNNSCRTEKGLLEPDPAAIHSFDVGGFLVRSAARVAPGLDKCGSEDLFASVAGGSKIYLREEVDRGGGQAAITTCLVQRQLPAGTRKRSYRDGAPGR